MSYQPTFTVTPRLMGQIERIAALREKILAATVQVAWIPALQKDTRARNAHGSTAIEGNPLTLEQVRALEEGRALPAATERAKREVLNYFAALRFIEKNLGVTPITHQHVLHLHKIIAAGGMDQGEAGRYREVAVRVGRHLLPPPNQVSGLMRELLEWWNTLAAQWPPVVSSAVVHFQFEDIHPFADGNGRAGRMLALWELYRRGFDTHHIFAVDEYYWEDRPRYYAELEAVRRRGGDLSGWLEYCAEGVQHTLEKAWLRVQRLTAEGGAMKVMLRPRQEQLLNLLRDKPGMTPAEVWEALGVTRQGASKLLKPLLDAGMIQRVGTKKGGKYILGGGEK
jgi:Fic family protein